MKILSFDIGIKNLAYCYLECENSYENKMIKHNFLKWNIINLLNDDNEKALCNCKLKNGKICNKNALYKFKTDFYCNLHYKNLDELAKNNCVSLSLQDKKCQGVKKPCKKNATFFYEDCVLCNTCLRKRDDKDNFLKIQKNGKTNADQDFFNLLAHHLDIHFDKLDFDFIILENQPAFKNPRMKSIQIFIFTYFFMKLRESKVKIDFFNASKKLDIYEGEEIETNKTTKYGKTKSLSIEYCKKFLDIYGNNDYNLNYLNKFKKKDDLADSYLQALQYCFKNKKKIFI